MRNVFRFKPINFCILTAALFFTAIPFAQAQDCIDAYDDGYEDGYDDAMEDCPCPKIKPITAWSGFYLGAEGGFQVLEVEKKVHFEDNMIGTLRSNSSGLLGNVFAGYGKYYYDKYYLGGELFTGYSGATNTDSINTLGSTDNVKYSAGMSYGIALTPGYKFPGGPLLYARVGYERTDFTLKEYSTGTFQTSSSKSDWLSGYTIGLGMETNLYKNFDIRLDYRRSCYDSFSNPATGTKVTPTDNQGTFGLIYRPIF